MSVLVKAGGGENITPEVTAQTPLVAEILESLVGKVTLANATPETILVGYSAYVGRELVNGILEDLGAACARGTITFASRTTSFSVDTGIAEAKIFIMVPITNTTVPGQSSYTDLLYFNIEPFTDNNYQLMWAGTNINRHTTGNGYCSLLNGVFDYRYSNSGFAGTFQWIALA